MLIAPIVDDVLHHVGVAAVGNALEEASRLDADAALASGEGGLRHAGHHLGTVVEHALKLGIAPQDRGEQEAVAAAHIGEPFDAGEIVNLHDGVGSASRRIRHRALEGLALLRPLGQHSPDVLAIGLGDAVAAGAQTNGDMLVGARGKLLAEHHGHVAHRPGRVGLEHLADRRQRERARRAFLEHAEARQHPHDAIERRRMRADLTGDLLDWLGRAIHLVGNAEPRHARQRIGELLAEQELHHHQWRGQRGLRRSIGHLCLLSRGESCRAISARRLWLGKDRAEAACRDEFRCPIRATWLAGEVG